MGQFRRRNSERWARYNFTWLGIYTYLISRRSVLLGQLFVAKHVTSLGPIAWSAANTRTAWLQYLSLGKRKTSKRIIFVEIPFTHSHLFHADRFTAQFCFVKPSWIPFWYQYVFEIQAFLWRKRQFQRLLSFVIRFTKYGKSNQTLVGDFRSKEIYPGHFPFLSNACKFCCH